MDFKIIDLGLTNYSYALTLQKDIWSKVKDNLALSSIICCQHYPVITAGRGAKAENFLLSPEQIKKKGIEIFNADRGGDITYHGPGQLLFYPIFNLNNYAKDIHLFLRNLEEVVISYLGDLAINAQRLPGLTGVWINGKKIASIGIGIKNWTTYHGLSINIKRDCLENFNLIKPCGMDIKMTSLEDILNNVVDIEKTRCGILEKFQEVFLSEALL